MDRWLSEQVRRSNHGWLVILLRGLNLEHVSGRNLCRLLIHRHVLILEGRLRILEGVRLELQLPLGLKILFRNTLLRGLRARFERKASLNRLIEAWIKKVLSLIILQIESLLILREIRKTSKLVFLCHEVLA